MDSLNKSCCSGVLFPFVYPPILLSFLQLSSPKFSFFTLPFGLSDIPTEDIYSVTSCRDTENTCRLASTTLMPRKILRAGLLSAFIILDILVTISRVIVPRWASSTSNRDRTRAEQIEGMIE